MRTVILEVLDEYAAKGSGYFQQDNVLREVAKRLQIKRGSKFEQEIITIWSDLFRNGHVGWGYNLSNPNPPFLHLTDKGRKTLKHYSRDPANPDGYMDYLSSFSINEVANSYIREAILTYNNNCFKSSAVMIGAASESMILELRDILLDKMNKLEKNIPNKLNEWRLKIVIEEISDELGKNKNQMPKELRESFLIHWGAFSGQIRISRNEAGHPNNIESIKETNVHGLLLIFPELVKLINDLSDWISSSYE